MSYVLKELVHALAVRLSSSECTWEVGKALEKREKHSAAPRATQRFARAFPTSHVHSELDNRTLRMN